MPRATTPPIQIHLPPGVATNLVVARIDSGATYRARQPTGWRLGGSPSTAGEIKR